MLNPTAILLQVQMLFLLNTFVDLRELALNGVFSSDCPHSFACKCYREAEVWFGISSECIRLSKEYGLAQVGSFSGNVKVSVNKER